MTEFTLKGITTAQRNAMIWAYQVDGSFTSDEFKACWNVRTLFALQHKRVILFNPSTGHYYFNPDYAREIRAKLESWGVFLCDYADDFGAWFDAHIESARKPDPLPEPPADPEDTPILPMPPISDDETLPGDEIKPDVYTVKLDRCPQCDSPLIDFVGVQSDPIDGLISNFVCQKCGNAWGVDEDEESARMDGFLFNGEVRTAYFEDDYDCAFGGGGDPLGWMTHFRPDPAKVRADYQAGYVFVRKMTGSGWTKEDAIRFACKFLYPSAAFISGMQSFLFKSYRHEVRYCNWYHWQNESAREKWENHPANSIPF